MKLTKITKGLLGLFLLALINVLMASNCPENIGSDPKRYLYIPIPSVNVYCVAKAGNPELPELGYGYVPTQFMLQSITASGTTISGVSMGTILRFNTN